MGECKKNRGKRMASICLAFQMTAVMPASGRAIPSGQAPPSGRLSVSTGRYAAVIDPSVGGGSLSLSKNSDPAVAWNTLKEDLVPGTIMFWNGAAGFRRAGITPELILGSGTQSYGVRGVKLTGEAEGVKSWFLFGDEVVGAGAGLQNLSGGSEKMVAVVDNVPVVKDTNLSLTSPNNGYRNVLTASKPGGVWEALKDTAIRNVHTGRNWLSASSLPGTTKKLEWSYVFGDGGAGSYLSKANVYCRLNTKGSGAAELAEFFIEPGESYQYTMAAGKTTSDYPNSGLYQPEAKLLMNTPELQAAADTGEGIVLVNKWEDGEVRVDNGVVPLTLYTSMSLGLKKDVSTGMMELTVTKPPGQREGFLEIVLDTVGLKILSNTNPGALADSSFGTNVRLKFDASAMESDSVALTIEGKPAEIITGDDITLVRGQEGQIQMPVGLTGEVAWNVKIPKPDGSFVRNAGSSKIKRELKEGEADGNRKAEDTDGSHIASLRVMAGKNMLLSAREKGNVVVTAEDEHGKQKQWRVNVLYEDPANLPETGTKDFAVIRKRFKESLIGSDLTIAEGGMEILADIDAAAGKAWDMYAYKGMGTCQAIPWPGDEGAAGNLEIPYEDDAVEFRPAFQKILYMAKAYAAYGSRYYRNRDLLADMKQILTWLCVNCYTPKTQTDNWWTWEIGMPKDLLPTLILLYDDLTKEEIKLFTEAIYFFQPDPYHEGNIGTGSTHAQGYRTAQGANIIDCSGTAIGLGILREDNELVSLGQKASADTFVIQSLEDSTRVADRGYASGFYEDGSYLDHSHVPYLGSYGIEFLKGGSGIPPLFVGTPWEYPREVQKNLEFYLKEGFLNGIYDGLMLDCLKGRSVSRPGGSNRAAGRAAIVLMIRLLDSVSPEVEEELKLSLKEWLLLDTGFLDTLKGAENMAVKARALEILKDSSISGSIARTHKNLPLMDRALHRTDHFLMALSMYSERIQNTEIMNDENKYGWHQGSGMTYLYNGDTMQYTENFWNTVNPLRLSGTTLVSKNIGTGRPDSSGFAQGGDFRSGESWVGGSSIGTDGINGMSMTGEVRVKEGEGSPAVLYSPKFAAKKSWFMFGDQIVCLGAGITNSGENYPVESVIENRRLKPDAGNMLIIDGEEQELFLESVALQDIVNGNAVVAGKKIPDITWAHLEGNVLGSDIGYYFPSGNQTISVRKSRNSGDWSLVGTSAGSAVENYLEMWFDHGSNPNNDTYEYVLLPGMSAKETESYSKEPGIIVLANNPKVQAVYSRVDCVFGANIWTDEMTDIGDMKITGASSVMVKENEKGILTVAVSDPTMKNVSAVTVYLNKPVVEILETDKNVTAELTNDGVKLSVRMEGTNGFSSYATLQLDESLIP